ncbi:hypothetical protein KAU32_11455 [bacterium]|nr:hypothetical protein [bacterium]
MKILKSIITGFALLVLTSSMCSNNRPETDAYYYGSFDDIFITIVSERIVYNSPDECIINFTFKNIGKRHIAYYGTSPFHELYLSFSGDHSEDIRRIYQQGFSGVSGSMGSYIKPGGVEFSKFDLAEVTNLKEFLKPSIIRVNSEYRIDKQGPNFSEPLGWKSGNSFRLFINMESELVNSSLIVEPHKWNTAWEKEQSDAGVFTVFLGNIDGYSVKDIKQDTVLFNGTLKPVNIKITGSHKDMKGKVMMLKFKKKEGMEYLGIKEPGDIKKINISGQLNDDKWFHAEAEVEIEGAKEKGSQ